MTSPEELRLYLGCECGDHRHYIHVQGLRYQDWVNSITGSGLCAASNIVGVLNINIQPSFGFKAKLKDIFNLLRGRPVCVSEMLLCRGDTQELIDGLEKILEQNQPDA